MKNFKTLFVILAVLLLLPTAAFASPVGKITYIEGNVDITAGDKVRPAALGEPVSAGEILRSKAKAKAEVTFLDGNILRLAEGTRVRITDYQMGEGKTTTLDLLRGKTQNIVTGLAKGAKYEVHTPTAVCGVRGTNFFTYLQGGASHFVPKENTIYGYNKKMPQDVKTVDPGLSIVIPGADLPPVIQPMTSVEIDKHTSDTAPGTPTQEPGKTAQQTFGGVSWEPPEEWTVHVPGEDVKYYADIVFPFTNAPPPEVITAQGRLGGVLGDTTGIGNADLTLQYAADGYGGFLAPQLEVGNLTGLMQDASGVSGVITSIPGSWLGAFSGIHYNSTGFGLFIGYLSGNYSEATGSVSANGYVTRTSILIPNDPSNLTPIGDYIGTIILPDQLNNLSIEVPLIEEVNVYSVNEGSSYVAFLYGDTMPDTHDMTYLSNIDDSLLSAWAVVNDSESLSYSNDAGRTTWVAKYGSMGYNYFGYYFIVGNITGTHPVSGGVTDFEHLLLSGRDLLYLSPGSYGFDDTDQYVYTPGLMGYYNLEYWYNIDPETGYSSYSGGAGTLELKPTAFGGYWGYGIGSLYTNDEGYAVRSAGELGALASWTEPWDAPADIKVAGMYWANWFHDYGYGGYGSYDGDFAPGYLLSASIGSRPDYEFLSEECGDPHFYNGDFFGLAAGVVGPLAQTDSGLWERATKAAIAALYVKEYVQEDETVVRKAGWLTTYTSGSAEGGLTGGLYPNEMEYGLYNYFRLDGTLTATPVDSGTTLSDYTLKYSFTDGIRAGYSGEDASIQGEGGLAAYYFNAYDSSVDKAYDRPWGIFSISIGGTSEWEYNDETEEYDLITSGNPALFFGPVSSLNGRDIQIGGGSKTPGAKASYWLGTVYSAAWTETIAGEGIGEINGPLSGYYLSQTDMGTFDGVFYGLYDGPCDFGGWWIGDAVGTYYGTRLTFSGKIQEDTYGIAGLWGSIDPIADDATAITGILGMGTYTTVPDGEWTAKTGGKWTTTGGNPVYWKANIGGSSFFNGTTAGGFTGALSTGTLSYDGFTASLSSGRYMSLLGEGTVSSTFTGIYYEEIGMWVAEEVEFTLGELTTLFAFSSVIDGLSYKASLTGDDDESTTFSLQEDGFQGIMGGVDYDGYGLTFLGRLDQLVFSQEAPYLSASAITSYIPATSDFTYTFGGFLAVATDSANTVSGDIRALYSYSPSTAESGSTPLNGYGGFGGIFYSDDIDGTYEPATGIWEAAGNPVFYQMIDYAPEGIIATYEDGKTYIIWNQPPGNPQSYKVYLGTESGKYTNVYETKDTKLVLTDLAPDKTYYVSVAALFVSGKEMGPNEEIKFIGGKTTFEKKGIELPISLQLRILWQGLLALIN